MAWCAQLVRFSASLLWSLCRFMAEDHARSLLALIRASRANCEPPKHAAYIE